MTDGGSDEDKGRFRGRRKERTRGRKERTKERNEERRVIPDQPPGRVCAGNKERTICNSGDGLKASDRDIERQVREKRIS